MTLALRLLPLLLLASTPAALAQATPGAPKKPPAEFAHNAVGVWQFETGMVNRNCKLAGNMTVLHAKDGKYACTVIATQSCSGDPPIEIRMQESCVATQSGAKVTITSKVEKPLSVKPADLTETVRRNYAPDNFEVTLAPSGAEMKGMFHSLSDAAVRFWRYTELTS